MSSFWQLIVPEAATNLIENPSFERGTTGWAADGTNTIARSSEQSKFGVYSLKCTYQNHTNIAYYGITLTATAHTFSVWLYIPSSFDGMDVRISFASFTGISGGGPVRADMTKTDQWQRVSVTGTPDAGGLFGYLLVRATGTPTVGVYVYIDAADCVAADHETTHIDGDQNGCEWNGAEHNSTSTRSAQSRAGGRVYDLEDYGFYPEGQVGTGMPPIELDVQELALLPGAVLAGAKARARQFAIPGRFVGSSMSDLHDKRESLIAVLHPHAVPGTQPVRLRYTGATTTKQIAAHYRGGLELRRRAQDGFLERDVAIQFLAEDPHWYAVGERAVALDTSDSATLRYIAARLKSSGQWDPLGPPSSVTDLGGGITVYALAEDATYVYSGGLFENWDGDANADYIVRYHKANGTYSAIAALNGSVRDILVLPDGTVVFGGEFTNAGGDANADYVAQWDGSTVSAVGGGLTATVYSIAYWDDTIYVASGTSVYKWTGSAWSDLAPPNFNKVYAIGFGRDGTLYAGGRDSYYLGKIRLSSYDGSAWQTLLYNGTSGTATTGPIYTLAVLSDGRVVFGGDLGDIMYVTCNGVGIYRNGAVEALGSGVLSGGGAGIVYALAEDDLGNIWIAGDFDSTGAIDLDNVALWNGAAWARADIRLPSASVVKALLVSTSDPVIEANYDVWIGFDQAGTAYFAGSATVTSDGTARAYPRIEIYRSGGTSASLYMIRNETTGQGLQFKYDLLDEERLTIRLDLAKKTIVSSFFGERPEAVLTGSDLGSFALQPGDNLITCFVYTVGSPTIEAHMIWTEGYASVDG